MELNYKNIIYSHYQTYHTKHLYGNVTIESIRKQFTFWNYYYSEFLPNDKSVNILDAGCGDGGFVLWLTEFGFLTTIGIDMSKEMIDLGKAIKINNIYQADVIDHLLSKHNSYDIIFCRDVLEHLTKTEVVEVFKLFYSSLKTNGRLIIQVPNGYNPNYGKIFYNDFTHETLFSGAVINQVAKSTGFREIYVKEITPIPHGFFSMIRYILWKFLKMKYRFVQLVENGYASGYFSQNIIAEIRK